MPSAGAAATRRGARPVCPAGPQPMASLR
jgi:hypothetical protein